MDESIKGMVHSNPHDTEVEAALAVLPHLPELRAKIYKAFITHGAMTDEELATLPEFSGRVYSTVRKRRVELYQSGLLKRVGRKVNERGRHMAVWDLSATTAVDSKQEQETIMGHLKEIRKRCRCREIDLTEGLIRAFNYGAKAKTPITGVGV